MSIAERLAKSGRLDRLAEVRGRVQARLVETLGPKLYDTKLSEKEVHDLVNSKMRELLEAEENPLSGQERALIIQQGGDAILGLGPLETVLRDPEVAELMAAHPQR